MLARVHCIDWLILANLRLVKGKNMLYFFRVNELNRTITLVCLGSMSVDAMME